MRYSVIIPAAGSGTRMKASVPKVLLGISSSHNQHLGAVSPEETILGRTLSRFCADSGCSRAVVCYPVDWQAEFAPFAKLFPQVTLVQGGATRQQSVALGIEALASLPGVAGSEVVLVHDAARCNVSQEVIRRTVEGVVALGAVIAAVPVSDSVCRVAEGATVREYVDRSALYAVQTPQGFYLGDLLRAHRDAAEEKIQALDDASLVANIRPVRVVLGDPLNIKATHPHDLEVLRRIVVTSEEV